jgi:hypothetical protein
LISVLRAVREYRAKGERKERAPVQRGDVLGNLDGQAVDPDRTSRSGANDAADLSREEQSCGGKGDVLVRHGALGTDLGRNGSDPASEALDDLGHNWRLFSR